MTKAADKQRIRDIRADLLDCLDYEETCDADKARRVVTLVKKLLVMRPVSAGHAGSSMSWDVGQLRAIQEDARVWLASRGSNTGKGAGAGGGSSTVYHQPSCYFRR